MNNAEEARQKAEQVQEQAFTELSRLTLLLTDRRAKTAPEAPQTLPPVPSRLWSAMLAVVAVIVVLAALTAVAVHTGVIQLFP